MTDRQVELFKRYVLHSRQKSSEQVAQRVEFVAADPTVQVTEVIRDDGFVHGRVRPVADKEVAQAA